MPDCHPRRSGRSASATVEKPSPKPADPTPSTQPSATALARADVINQSGAAPDAALVSSLQTELAAANAECKSAKETARADAEAKARLTVERDAALKTCTTAAELAEMRADLAERKHKDATNDALEALKKEMEAKADEVRKVEDAAKAELEGRNKELLDEVAALKTQLEASSAAAKGTKRARARAADAPTGPASQAFLADMVAKGIDVPVPGPKRAAKGPFPDFVGPEVEWTVVGSGAEAFCGLVGITGKVSDLGNFYHEVRWPIEALRFAGASYNQGLAEGEVANFEAALRTMAGAGPWTIDGVEYKNRTMWFMASGWPELGVTPDMVKLEETELNKKAINQMKKVKCGIDLLVQAYNLYMMGVLKKEGFVPIKRTKEDHEATRGGKVMKALDMIKKKIARDAGHVSLVGVLTHGAPAAAADTDATMPDADAGAPAEADTGLDALAEVPAAVPAAEPVFEVGAEVHFVHIIDDFSRTHIGVVAEDNGGPTIVVTSETSGGKDMPVAREIVVAGHP